MLKPPTLLLLLSYGIFFAAWDAQAATALSLSGLRADLHASVDERQTDIEDKNDETLSASSPVGSSSSRFGFRNAAHSIAQSIRAFFQGSPLVHQPPSGVTILRGIASSHSWEAASSPGGPHWHGADLADSQRLTRHSPPVAALAATPSTDLPSFLLTASSALRFQHRLRTIA